MTAAVLLNNQSGTLLYAPAQPGAMEQMLYLQWSGPAQATLTVDLAWEEAGYLLFLSLMPGAHRMAAFEAALRGTLPDPKAASVAWVEASADGAVVSANVVSLEIVDGARVAAADATILAPAPLPSVPIVRGTPVVPVRDEGAFLVGLSLLYPTLDAFEGQPAAQVPLGTGISLPLAGDGVGCVRFAALRPVPKAPPPSAVFQQGYDVSIDPFRPTESERTFLRFNGVALTLTRTGTTAPGFAIAPADPD